MGVRLTIRQEQREAARELAKKAIADEKKGFSWEFYGGDEEKAYYGFLGEIIYADYFGLPRPSLIVGDLDPGYDFLHNGVRVDVKSVPWEGNYVTPQLILFKSDLDKACDCYFLLKITQYEAELVGGIKKDHVKLIAEKVDFGYGPRWAVPGGYLCQELEVFARNETDGRW